MTAEDAGRCNRLVMPLADMRCGLPEADAAHDPLGRTPWPPSFFESGVHPFDSVPLDPDEPEPTYWDGNN